MEKSEGVKNTRRGGGVKLGFKNKSFLPSQEHHLNVNNKEIKK